MSHCWTGHVLLVFQQKRVGGEATGVGILFFALTFWVVAEVVTQP